MSGSDGAQMQEQAVEGETTTVGAYYSDADRIRLLKRKIKVTTQQDVLKHLLDFYEGKIRKPKEEMVDGVHSS